jgi:hypothetical protein
MIRCIKNNIKVNQFINMVNLCNICFEFFKSGKNIKDITNVKIVEKNQCNGLHHKKLIDSFKT